MSNFLTTVVDVGKKAAQFALNQATAQPAYAPIAGSPYYGSPPIVSDERDEAQPWYYGLEKVKDDFIAQLKGAAKDTVAAVAGGTVQAIQETPEFRAEKARATFAFFGIGVIAIVALAMATRKAA